MVPMSVDLVALVADLIPRPLPHNMGDWPEEERDAFEEASRNDPIHRDDILARMRQEKAARAILAALRIETLTDERDRLAAAVDSLSVANPTEQDRRRFKLNRGALYAYVRAYERSKAYGLAGDLVSGASSGEAAANRLWRRAEQERPNA
jgi:hypothetical protein